MKKFCLNLKTSDKITFLFTVFNFVSLLILLIGINIIYFYSWYSDQKFESTYDMDKNYAMYSESKNISNLEAFQEYILQKDTLIIPNNGGELICSNGVETRVHSNVDLIKDKWFYSNGEKVFFIFSQYYEEIWEVKVFFDTTPYVKSQIIILKISFFIILFSLIIYFFIWRKIAKFWLRHLKNIAEISKNIDIENYVEEIKIIWNKQDEMNILANSLNKSFSHIQKQATTLKQFITDVSHEFKTPLMVINSQIDLYNKKLEKGKISETDMWSLLNIIKNNTKKLNNLLETFLLLSRIENGIEKLDITQKDGEKYMKDIVQHYVSSTSQTSNITYKFSKNFELNIEENTFNILFENLLSNAIKFSKNSWKIEIWWNMKGFWIQDDGIWIPKESIDHIWEKFFRWDMNKEWFGIWLFIVKRICDLYKWDISVKSEKNKGTKFSIKFHEHE